MALILLALVALFAAQATSAGRMPSDRITLELARLRADGFPLVDYHAHLKEGLTVDEVLRRERELGIKAGIDSERRSSGWRKPRG